MSSYSAYSEKLKDPRWQRKRLKVLERDDFTCKKCKASHLTLHVHHAFYERDKEPWEYDDRHLHSLCTNCHTSIEDLKEKIFQRIGELFQTHEELEQFRWHLDDLVHFRTEMGFLHLYIKDFLIDIKTSFVNARHMDQVE